MDQNQGRSQGQASLNRNVALHCEELTKNKLQILHFCYKYGYRHIAYNHGRIN